MNVTVGQIRTFLSSHDRYALADASLVPAGVLIPFLEREGELRILLTKRTEGVEHHKGQISFPGGARDEDDGSIVETALRETREEIGLTPDHIQVLGIFDDLPTHTGFLITPVVGFIPLVPKLKPNSTEVSEIFDVPFSLFTDKRNETRKKIERNGIVREAYFYYHGTHEIWGITAAIIRSFVDALQNANSPRTGRLRSGRR